VERENDRFRGGSNVFACHTLAGPERVWAALTDPDRTSCYLYGLAAHSTWEPDAAISLERAGRTWLGGHVVCSRPNERLSYALGADPNDPPVYLTWLIRSTSAGCVIRLEVDELESADAKGSEDAEDTWLPILAALQRELAR